VTHHRWILACILMPISFVFDGFWNLRAKVRTPCCSPVLPTPRVI
jgi:hypothetical protein